MLTKHRLKYYVGVLRGPGIVSINPEPMHLLVAYTDLVSPFQQRGHCFPPDMQ